MEKIKENEKEYQVSVEKEKEEFVKKIKVKVKKGSSNDTIIPTPSFAPVSHSRTEGGVFRSRFLLPPGEVETSSDEENDLSSDEEQQVKVKKVKEIREVKEKRVKEVVEDTNESDDEELNDYSIEEKIKEMIKKRGVKSTSSSLVLYEKLVKYLSKAESKRTKIQVYMQMLTTQFDINPNFLPYTPIDVWNQCYLNVMEMMKIINENEIIIFESSTLDENQQDNNNSGVIKIHGNLYSIVERMDDEFTRSLQNIDPHTQDYLERLKDETLLLNITSIIYEYYKKQKEYLKSTRISARLLDHTYFRKEKELSKELLRNIYMYGDDREKTRAILEEIYFLSIQNKFYEAKEIFLMSKLQDTIHRTDISTQILYNRTITQIGLCAFRLGLYSHCYQWLSEIVTSQRTKELLAQGITIRHVVVSTGISSSSSQTSVSVSSSGDKSKKLEKEQKEERNRLVPYHMHINLDMIESVHLLSAMLLEVPILMTKNSMDKKKLLSKTFRRLLDFYDRQIFTGPPENTKDHINTSARSLMKGNWKECFQVISKLNVWNNIQDSEMTLELLKENIKMVALKTWLLSNSTCFHTISFKKLKEMFELNVDQIELIIKQMILKESFNALLDDEYLILQSVQPSNLEFHSIKLLERSSQLNEIHLFSIDLDSKKQLKKKK
jgi:translation initiation factor 3 subunit C